MLEYKGEKHDAVSQMEVRWGLLVRLHERADAAAAKLEAARALLRQLEWSAIDMGEARCPVCQGAEPDPTGTVAPAGHKPGCELAALLT